MFMIKLPCYFFQQARISKDKTQIVNKHHDHKYQPNILPNRRWKETHHAFKMLQIGTRSKIEILNNVENTC